MKTWADAFAVALVAALYLGTFILAVAIGNVGTWAVCMIGIPVGALALVGLIIWLDSKAL